MNFTVTSRGRQFDRLAIMYFNDTEVWRTSTAEPTADGIRWEYNKDMTPFLYFWNSPQKIIFDLGNLINDIYTGPFNTTLTATFSQSDGVAEPATLILPVSAKKGSDSAASVFILPNDNATNFVNLPRNANRAVFSISACGQAEEEFWWSNTLHSNIHTFEPQAGTLLGYSPFREVQLLIDGTLAGVQWPFPVIFTGGVVPGLWRPIVGIDAFDLREYEIDVTPWLPILCDGNPHSFEIRVIGIDDDGNDNGTLTKTVGNSWYVTGKIFLWLDKDPKAVTTGRAPTILLPEPVINLCQKVTQSKTGANETLKFSVNVQRILSISSLINTQLGSRLVTWTQSLSVTDHGTFTNFGVMQESCHNTAGTDQSTGGIHFRNSYEYPLYANTSFVMEPSGSGNFSLDANLLLGLNINTQGASIYNSRYNNQETSLSTLQNGTAHYFASPKTKISTGFGRTHQKFDFRAVSGSKKGELYNRDVEAINGTVVKDHENSDGVQKEPEVAEKSVHYDLDVPIIAGPREALGRGPGGT